MYLFKTIIIANKPTYYFYHYFLALILIIIFIAIAIIIIIIINYFNLALLDNSQNLRSYYHP